MSTSSNQKFDPGPSFTELAKPQVRTSELPAWLQTFAATVGEPDQDELAEPEADLNQGIDELPEVEELAEESEVLSTSEPDFPEASAVPEDDMSMPGWLNEPRPVPEPAFNEIPEDEQTESAAVEQSATAMIDEDDLPEWLRSMQPGLSSARADEQIADNLEDAQASRLNGAMTVPSIARSWVLNDGSSSLNDGGSLFSLVANQSSSSASSGEDAGHYAAASATSRDNHEPDTERSASGATAATRVDREMPALRVMLLALLVIVIVVLVVLFAL